MSNSNSHSAQAPRLVIGNLELCSLPELGIKDVEVRIDTGAKTSSLHADNLQRYQHQGKPWVSFDLHPDVYNLSQTVSCSAPLYDSRKVKSSNGETERRSVIRTLLKMGPLERMIELTLTDRQDMSYPMLLGREGMADKVLVDPSASFLASVESG
ncbi:ATP-dependent zinc protease family protein [Aliagarivorans marinus]|uniref:ATP-dependent zinc protease family protein n=1 Tax=Aliagarivorans marinus TaxID=561965 RepID=UPI00041D0D7D|nr:RimK/LysX family protein [Aliagarivorans marinus]